MEYLAATHAFATLGRPGLLADFRLLVRFVPRGVRPTEIAEAIGLKANTLPYSENVDTTEGLKDLRPSTRAIGGRPRRGVKTFTRQPCVFPDPTVLGSRQKPIRR